MEENGKIEKRVVNNFFGNINNYHHYEAPVTYNAPVNFHADAGESKATAAKGECTDEQIHCAVERCQKDFWGASAWAIVYRVLQADFGEQRSVSKFEDDMYALSADLDWQCSKNTVSEALSNNKVLREKPDTWETKGAKQRIVTLRDSLIIALKSIQT